MKKLSQLVEAARKAAMAAQVEASDYPELYTWLGDAYKTVVKVQRAIDRSVRANPRLIEESTSPQTQGRKSA